MSNPFYGGERVAHLEYSPPDTSFGYCDYVPRHDILVANKGWNMLDHLRKQVIDTLNRATHVALSTNGIAGLQMSILPCESTGLYLYVLVPQTSEHLINIGNNPECVAATEQWQLRGSAKLASMSDISKLELSRTHDIEWSALIKIRPTQLHVAAQEGVGYAATIDIDESALKEIDHEEPSINRPARTHLNHHLHPIARHFGQRNEFK